MHRILVRLLYVTGFNERSIASCAEMRLTLVTTHPQQAAFSQLLLFYLLLFIH